MRRVLPVRAWAYIVFIAMLGTALVVRGAFLTSKDTWGTVIPLALLLVLASAFDISLSSDQKITVGVTMPVAVSSVLLVPHASVAIVTVFMAVSGRQSVPMRMFNMGMGAIIGWAASGVYGLLGGQLLTEGSDFTVMHVLLPFIAAAFTYEVVNGFMMVVIIALTENVSPLRVWYGTLAQSAVPMFIYSAFGLMLAVVWPLVGALSAVLVLAPLMVARWVFAMFAMRQQAYERTMQSLIKAVETKDFYTRGHSERVSKASVMIGRRSGMREDRVTTLRYAGMLHDVGKLGVPTEVLQASGKLTDEQYSAIQKHPVRGRDITRDIEFLGEAVQGIYHHHERIDGRGYPDGLKGAEIPEFARIIAVADAFDSMTTTRSYRGARSVEDAVDELRRCKGSQFDPIMVEALVSAVESEGWETVDTSTPLPLVGAIPSFGSDDDDPTALGQLGMLPMAVPNDASEITDADVGDRVGDERA